MGTNIIKIKHLYVTITIFFLSFNFLRASKCTGSWLIINKCNVNTIKNIIVIILFLESDENDDKIVLFGTEGFIRRPLKAEVIFM